MDLVFEPLAFGAKHFFDIRENPSDLEWENRDGIRWSIRLSRGEPYALLASGVMLRDLRGSVVINPATPRPEGSASRESPDASVGSLYWYAAETDADDESVALPERYEIGVDVPPRTYERLLRWAIAGKLPRLHLEFLDNDKGWVSDSDSVTWDTGIALKIPILWCTFEVLVNEPMSDNPKAKA